MALMSIQAMKGVEIGAGFGAAASAARRCSIPSFTTARRSCGRRNNMGGVEGGITNGEPVVARAAMKPIPTLARPLPSVDLATKQPFDAQKERTDSCAVPAAAVVAEAALAFVLADALARQARRRHHGRGACAAWRRTVPTSQSIKVLRPIFLIGLSGGGKSTVGLLLAAKLERRFVDLDAVIEEEAHMTVAEIFFNEREGGFRAREAAALRRVTAQGPQVIAVGGGAPAHGDNMDFMLHAGKVVLL